MPNANPQAVAFANSKIRPMADILYAAYQTAKSVLAQWNAQGVATVIPNDAVVISDGAATDGRAPITDAQATAIVTRCQEMVSWMENGLIASPFNVALSNATLNTVAAVQVNGKAEL